MFLKAGTSKKALKVLLDEKNTFIFETNENYIHGMPIPPLARALRTLIRREKFHKANAVIADEMLVPLRMMFPIDRSGGTQMPNTQSRVLSLSGHSQKVRAELDKWKKDKSHIPVLPIEVGSKDFWGNGKMLALEPLLDMTTKDLLAELGIPIEFIYGGATWSRQNVSAIVLENTIANMANRSQQLLDHVSEKLQEVVGNEEKISIHIKTPRIVEGLAEMTFLKDAKDKREITEHTYFGKLGIDVDAQNEMLPEEEGTVKERGLNEMKRIVEAEIEGARMKLKFRQEEAETERKESLKDSVAMGAIKADEMAAEIDAKKKMLKEDIVAQEYMAALNLDQQKELLSDQEQSQVRQMERSIQNNPSIEGDVLGVIKQQLIMQEQTKLYAYKLYNYKDTPEEQQKVIPELNDRAPEIFKAQVIAYYEKYLQQDVTDIHLKAVSTKARSKLVEIKELQVEEVSRIYKTLVMKLEEV